jgi:ATP-dependent 26S proteasome regulatory subunit
MTIDEQLKALISASYPVIYLATWEEDRCMNMLGRVAQEQGLKVYAWSTSAGMVDQAGKQVFPELKDPGQLRVYLPSLLQSLLTFKEEGVLLVLKDLHPYVKEPIITRLLRDIVSHFKTCGKTLILLSPVVEVPLELEKDITIVDYKLPDETEVEEILDRLAAEIGEQNPEVEMNLEAPQAKDKFLKAMLGLTQGEIENTLAKIVVQNKRLDIRDIPAILGEKEQIIRKSGILEFYASSDSFGDIGGLHELKAWLRMRVEAFSEDARRLHLPAPKGILLVGVPGCGKSLCAKAVASEWAKPLLKFDMGKIYGSYLGQSEANLRKAIQVAEGVAPAILWIDEIEKGLAGGSGDSGVSQRILGSLLTWMEEKTSPVFVVATANQIGGLPPELLRKGRIDEIFFVDLPNGEERTEVFNVHLAKRNRNPLVFDVERLVAETEGFSGAEIEQIIIDALFEAYHARAELDTDMVLHSIEATVPLSKSMGESIKRLREWASDRCRFASARAETTGVAPERAAIDITAKSGKKPPGRRLEIPKD